MSASSLASSPQLQPHMDENLPHLTAQPLTIASSPFQLFSVLPPPLLALVAAHLDAAFLLSLQRCSSSHRRICADDTYMVAAWRWAELKVSTRERLHEWTMPWKQCITSSARLMVPVSMWQAALPVWRAVATRTHAEKKDEQEQRHGWRRAAVERQQPTEWISAKRNDYSDGLWQLVDEESAASESADVRRVEVLRDINWWQLGETVPSYHDVEVRCRFVLHACPYLQHLDLYADANVCEAPSHADTFALVPHLRSLRLEQSDSGRTSTKPLFDIRAMLDSLPHLHTLRCSDIKELGVAELLDIASHCTLEDVHIHGKTVRKCHSQMTAAAWIGHDVQFPISVEEDEAGLERMEHGHHHEAKARGGVEEDDTVMMKDALIDSELAPHGHGDEERDELQRMHAELTRTQPSRRSCEVRLALADWLHRRLRRGGLGTNEHLPHPEPAKPMLHRYRLMVALLQSTLHRQLSELAAATTTSSLADASLKSLYAAV